MTQQMAAQTVPLNDLGRLGADERDAIVAGVAGVVDSGWFLAGANVSSFEAEFGAYLGVDQVVGVANGTDALELAMRAILSGPGAEVVMAANAGGYAATAANVVGAQIVFAEVDERGLLDPDSAAGALSDRTGAVVVTHLYGQCADVAQLRKVIPAEIPIIEDCAQAHGARRGDAIAGTMGTVATFSFYPTKNLGAFGDAGAVVTSSAELADRIRQLRSYGWSTKYQADVAGGRNSRMDEMQAAILRVRLPYLDERNARRRDILAAYRDVSGARFLGADDPGGVAHLAVMLHDDRDQARVALNERGIATDVHYPIPDYRQAAWRADHVSLPKTEALCDSILTVPLFPQMTDLEVETVCAALVQL